MPTEAQGPSPEGFKTQQLKWIRNNFAMWGVTALDGFHPGTKPKVRNPNDTLIQRVLISDQCNDSDDHWKRMELVLDGMYALNGTVDLTQQDSFAFARRAIEGEVTEPVHVKKVIGASNIFNPQVASYIVPDLIMVDNFRRKELGIETYMHIVRCENTGIAINYPDQSELVRAVMDLNVAVLQKYCEVRWEDDCPQFFIETDPKWEDEEYKRFRGEYRDKFVEIYNGKWDRTNNPEEFTIQQILKQLERFEDQENVNSIKKAIEYATSFTYILDLAQKQKHSELSIIRSPRGTRIAQQLVQVIRRKESISSTTREASPYIAFEDITTSGTPGYKGDELCIPPYLLLTEDGEEVLVEQMCAPLLVDEDLQHAKYRLIKTFATVGALNLLNLKDVTKTSAKAFEFVSDRIRNVYYKQVLRPVLASNPDLVEKIYALTPPTIMSAQLANFEAVARRIKGQEATSDGKVNIVYALEP